MSASLVAILAACSTSGPADTGQSGQTQPAAPVVQANCPQVIISTEQAYNRVYARGAKDDPAKVAYQVSLADTTRTCAMSGDTLSIRVMAQGRLVLGPEGAPGTFTVPVRITVEDGETTLYSQVSTASVSLSAGQTSTQFLLDKPGIEIANAQGGAPRFSKVTVALETGVKETAKKRR